MKLVYQIGTNLYFLIVRLFALWNPKAKLFIKGREEAIQKLKVFSAGEFVYWFHCASLGEFEQARPLIEAIKKRSENNQIVVTFFSPSGYEIRKNYELADLILYLPRDSKRNAQFLLNKIQPTKIFFVKYEFWANYLLAANHRNIPTYLISGVFRKKQVFFKWYGGFMRKVLKSFTAIYLQNENSQVLLKSIGVKSVVTGDTRFDRVMENAQKVKHFPLIENFIDQQKCIVVGSNWAEDDQVIASTLNGLDQVKIIIAPHEIHKSRIKAVESKFSQKSIKLSELESTKNSKAFNVLIIDNIGMLMHLYQYADLAYVGGAFGKGLHNILEPACFGVPVIFGDNYSKFPEAFQFIEAKIGHSVSNSKEFELIFNGLLKRNEKSKVLTFMSSQVGATAKIIETVFN